MRKEGIIMNDIDMEIAVADKIIESHRNTSTDWVERAKQAAVKSGNEIVKLLVDWALM